jgi:phosphatidylglycerol:prolipoprotein diacylglycerol transferase
VFGPFVHRIDPVIADVAGIHLWWYGLSYALGFLEVLWIVSRRRRRMGLTCSEAYTLSLVFAICVLTGGRAVEVAFDEWAFYREHPSLIPALWLGGMATHGLLLGAAAGTYLFALGARKSFMTIADEIVIPGAFLMGIGRVGNFIDGQIVGRVTDASWGVLFPGAEGFRHPVVLYDGLKNFLLVPLLLQVRRAQPPPGRAAAHFVFWYAFLRIFVDLFRDYPTHRLAWGTGQTLNAIMALTGFALLVRSHLKNRPPRVVPPPAPDTRPGTAQRLAFAAVLLSSLSIPSNWTQDVPATYGSRHTGLRHSWIYPAIDTRPPGAITRRSSAATPARHRARRLRGPG